jgi:hypothetical protein
MSDRVLANFCQYTVAECENFERIDSASSLPLDLVNDAPMQDQSLDNKTVQSLGQTSLSDVSLPSSVIYSETLPTEDKNYDTKGQEVLSEEVHALQYLPPSPLEYLPADLGEEEQDVSKRNDYHDVDATQSVNATEVTADEEEFQDSLAVPAVRFKIGEFEDRTANDQEVAESPESAGSNHCCVS